MNIDTTRQAAVEYFITNYGWFSIGLQVNTKLDLVARYKFNGKIKFVLRHV